MPTIAFFSSYTHVTPCLYLGLLHIILSPTVPKDGKMAASSKDKGEASLFEAMKAWFFAIIQPHESITDEVERERLRFIIGSFFVFTLSFFFVLSVFLLFLPEPSFLMAVVFVIISHIISYTLARTPRHALATSISPITLHMASWFAILTSPNDVAIGAAFTTIFVMGTANLWLGSRATIIAVIANIIVVLFASVTKNFQVTIPVFAVLVLIVTAILLIVQDLYRRNLERTRVVVLEQAVQTEQLARKVTEEANVELKRATALAKENARLRSEFLATMSHELRTPLNAIRGFCGIMLNGMGGEIDDDARHMVTRIEDNGARLLALVNDVLDLSRIEAGRMEAQNVTFNPHQLAQSWHDQMSALALEKHIAFTVNVRHDMPTALIGDPERITQVAINLLANAFKFTHEGSVSVEVVPHGELWRITVTDTGIGIPQHALNYIFDEFRQLDSSSTRQYGGSGLGLSIVRNLTRIMEGTITVTSEVNKGSTFTLLLPMTHAENPITV